MNTNRFPFRFSLAALVLTAACASLGTEEDQSKAGGLWAEIDGYREWSQFDDFPGIQKSKSRVHGVFVATYLNAPASASQDDLPFGSILVKENFSKEDRASLTGITVMKRIEGYDADSNDWFWARYDPSGDLTHSGQVAMCADCHFDAEGDDFVFLND